MLFALLLTSQGPAAIGGNLLHQSGLVPDSSETPYQERLIHHPDGIGKFYLGREIAQVMGHQGAGWLERSSRDLEERPQLLLEALTLKPTDVVADIGAGTGYFSFRLAPLLPQGKVLAVDIQPEMVEILNVLKQEHQAINVQAILGRKTDPGLPDSSVNLALLVDTYHEFEYPREMMLALAKALKPGGRVVLVEYRGENPLIPIKKLHKMTKKQVMKELNAIGLTWRDTIESLPQQHILIFENLIPSDHG
ncbi:methyltransferase domain-containing protein [Leptolyngbya sp. 'hensonii']|uniref:class I SAM-dependent methyltransferase n=1 Tax=Leptolyngbya sp. 'hensonii' TaxID=1922337 RepID=UPI000B1C723E|nr:methyltransferase domain-containing protein [Leptolyngbya sp. 'hensonii']